MNGEDGMISITGTTIAVDHIKKTARLFNMNIILCVRLNMSDT